MQTMISSQHHAFARSLKPHILLLIIVMGFTPTPARSAAESRLWEPAEWTFRNLTFSSNPFDITAKATFTHAPTGRTIRTGLYYDGGETWKLRFTGTHTGRWDFVTDSADPELNGLEGSVEVLPNPGAAGFLTNFGGKWGRLGIDRAFVPQYVMYRDLPAFQNNPDAIDADIRRRL
ncbi:MAG: DUF5060 domain-containing protein [Planctomycetota bacterium]|jgi:hypothetical protein